MWKEFLSKNGLTFWYLKRLKFNLMRKLICFSGTLVASYSLEIKPKTPGVARKASFIGHLSVPKFTNLFPSSRPLHKPFCLSAFHVLLLFFLYSSFFPSFLSLNCTFLISDCPIYSITIFSLPNLWYLLSHHSVFCAVCSFCLFVICFPPLELHSWK